VESRFRRVDSGVQGGRGKRGAILLSLVGGV
jgi:hypothetical protein